MIEFHKTDLTARFGDPRLDFALVDLCVEVRVCPLSGLRTRVTPTRVMGKNLSARVWPDLTEPVAQSREDCPFCPDAIASRACTLDLERFGVRHLTRGAAFLFPNIAPYGPYSAVTVIGPEHYVEVGSYDRDRYLDAFLVSRDYVRRIQSFDSSVTVAAITQNHLPASGGSLVHPHLQVQADHFGPAYAANLPLWQHAAAARDGRAFWPHLVETEKQLGQRHIGATGAWDWLTMWAPQGYLEVWGAADVPATAAALTDDLAGEMVDGLLRIQRWYRRRGCNSFNLALYFAEPAHDHVRLACRIMARNNWAPFARNDRSFFEVVLGEHATDQRPENWAAELRANFT